jgi:hypothetical protein
MHDQPASAKRPKRLRQRVLWGFTFALTIALSTYLVIDAGKTTHAAFVSLWFLAVLPAYLCALICYVGDPDHNRSSAFYALLSPIFVGIVVLGSAFFLHEGVICLIMLAPIWVCFGWLGTFLVRGLRKRPNNPGVFHSSLLLLPLISGGMESQIPIPYETVTVRREIVIHATPDEIWPYAVSNNSISEDEGRWTFTHNLVGIPRPHKTVLKGEGVGSLRTAFWGDEINFDEKITQWEPGRVLGWSFYFNNNSLQEYTDKHISPDGDFLKIDNGNYTMIPLGADTTLVTLRTNYIAKTHVNIYAKLWGEIFLGDIQNNVLEIIKHRAEAKH